MMSPAVAAAALAVRLAQSRTRIVARAENVFRSRRKIRRARMSYPYADAAVGISLGVSSELAGVCDVPRDRIHTIYNPAVPDDLPLKIREAADHPWCREPGPPLIVAIGRLHRQKDFPTLLTAFARLLERRPARLLVLGKGPQLSELSKLTGELGISRHVDFPGFVDNPYAFLARAQLFVLFPARGLWKRPRRSDGMRLSGGQPPTAPPDPVRSWRMGVGVNSFPLATRPPSPRRWPARWNRRHGERPFAIGRASSPWSARSAATRSFFSGDEFVIPACRSAPSR